MANNSGGGAHDDYLNAPETAGRPMAITSLLLVFLLVAGVALALFVGGRWLYEQYLKDDKQTVVQEDSNQASSQNNGESALSGQAPSDGPTNSTSGSPSDSATSNSDSTDTNTNNTSGGTNSTSSPQNNETTSGSSSAGSSATGNNSGEQSAINGSVTGPAPEQVPSTGTEHVFAIVLGTSILATFAHRHLLLKKQQ